MSSEMLTLVNGERAKAGSPPLRLNELLNKAATAHSQWMAAQGTLSHTGAGGSTVAQRLATVGYQASWAGENVAYNHDVGSPIDDFHRQWMSSAGHKANILNTNYQEMGFGVATGGGKAYGTQVFARPRSGTVPLPTPPSGPTSPPLPPPPSGPTPDPDRPERTDEERERRRRRRRERRA